MVETLESFAQGFFGRNSQDQFSMWLQIEAKGLNSTEAPDKSCPGQAVDPVNAAAAAKQFYTAAFAPTAKRLQQYISGLTLDWDDVIALVRTCAYETGALGYSAFCDQFDEDDFRNVEYYTDLYVYYGYTFGAQSAAAIGKGMAEECLARFTKTPITVWDSATNSTVDGNPLTFPLDQSIYIDASHDTDITAILTAMNITAINGGILPVG